MGNNQTLSFRWEFTIPTGARAGGEVHLRAIHLTPTQAEDQKVGNDNGNVLAVDVVKPIPTYTLGATPDLNMGFTPPFLPSICSDEPLTMLEYKKYTDYFLFNVHQKFLKYEDQEVPYIIENNANGRGVMNHSRFPEPLKQYKILGTFTPQGNFFYTKLSFKIHSVFPSHIS